MLGVTVFASGSSFDLKASTAFSSMSLLPLVEIMTGSMTSATPLGIFSATVRIMSSVGSIPVL